ncbi:MAG: phage tail sheath C-terminal domain-containing protein [Bacteroidota bacterium]
MAKVYATPGVYIEEKSAFPNSAVTVATAVPAFIGFTEKAERNNKPLKGIPTRISSFGEYLNFFGSGFTTQYTFTPPADGAPFSLAPAGKHFLLYNAMRSFFANGGSDCYIISVGSYADAVTPAALVGGIEPLLKEPEPTMLVVPDAVMIPSGDDGNEADYNSVMTAMLSHCAKEQKRICILDVKKGMLKRTRGADDVITEFREGVGVNNLQWGAAYYPWVQSSIVPANEINYTNIANRDVLRTFLVDELKAAQAVIEKDEEKLKAVNDLIDGVISSGAAPESMEPENKRVVETALELAKLAPPAEGAEDKVNDNLNNTLLAISPAFKAVMGEVRNQLNLMPPSAMMAGVYSMVDNQVGVFQSPANVSLGSVVRPSVDLTSEEQEDLNLPLNGKAVNAIRTFPGKGVLVWGARTLDGNSQDWRYISVRRTMIMIEQSIKNAAEAYVFEPNTASTWTNMKALITNFLTNVWQQGGLAGATAEDAFSVDVGLGTTMTPNDILDGLMKITVKVAITRPAEFIVITFQQQMQQS